MGFPSRVLCRSSDLGFKFNFRNLLVLMSTLSGLGRLIGFRTVDLIPLSIPSTLNPEP